MVILFNLLCNIYYISFLGYESELLSSLSQVQYVDGIDRSGNSARETDTLSNIPGNIQDPNKAMLKLMG